MSERIALEMLISFVGALALLPAASRLAHVLGFLDRPNARRRHRAPTPLLGGAAVLGAWGLGMLVYFFLFADAPGGTDAVCFIAGAVAMMAVGLFDDRHGLTAGRRILLEFAIAAAFVSVSPSVRAFATPWVAVFGPGIWPLLCLWIVGASNAVNLIDGSDGLAGTVTALICAELVLLGGAWGTGSGAAGAALASLLLPILVFLRRNWSPASIFLGDNGSLSIGFVLSGSALMLVPAKVSAGHFAGMLACLGYPILDTGLSSWRRRRVGLSVMRADRGHLHHRLARLGLKPASVALAAGAISLACQLWSAAAFALGTLADSRKEAVGCALLLACATVALYVLTRVLSREERRRTEPQERAAAAALDTLAAQRCAVREYVLVRISLDPLLTTALEVEGARWDDHLVKVLAEIYSAAGPEGQIVRQGRDICVLCLEQGSDTSPENERRRFSDRLRALQAAESIQLTTSELPIKASWQKVYEPGGEARSRVDGAYYNPTITH